MLGATTTLCNGTSIVAGVPPDSGAGLTLHFAARSGTWSASR
jgi:hypothetical protein